MMGRPAVDPGAAGGSYGSGGGGSENEWWSTKENELGKDSTLETFWTLCTMCVLCYECSRTYLNTILRSHKCGNPYTAGEIPTPLPNVSSWGTVLHRPTTVKNYYALVKETVPQNCPSIGGSQTPPSFAIQALCARLQRGKSKRHREGAQDCALRQEVLRRKFYSSSKSGAGLANELPGANFDDGTIPRTHVDREPMSFWTVCTSCKFNQPVEETIPPSVERASFSIVDSTRASASSATQGAHDVQPPSKKVKRAPGYRKVASRKEKINGTREIWNMLMKSKSIILQKLTELMSAALSVGSNELNAADKKMAGRNW